MRTLGVGARRVRAAWAAVLIVLLATAGLVYAGRSASGPIEFSISGPSRVIVGHPVMLEFKVTNDSKNALKVLKPAPPYFIVGEINTPTKSGLPFPDDSTSWRLYPEPARVLQPSESWAHPFEIGFYIDLGLRGTPVVPGRYTVRLSYVSKAVRGLPAPTWEGKLGPVSHSFEVVPGPPPPPPPPVIYTPEEIREREARKVEEARKRKQGLDAMQRLSDRRNALLAERVARRKRLQKEADQLPPAPNEKKSLLTEPQIDARVRAAGKAGVFDQMRFGPDSPVETYESVRERFFVENLERLIAIRRKYLPTHKRLQKERNEWLTEAPEDRSLQARQKMIDQAAALEPLASEEQKRFEQMRTSLLADGELSAADYNRLEQLLSSIAAARKKKK